MSIVVVPWDALCGGSSLDTSIEAAFGPAGLGLLAVSGVPRHAAARARLLPLASRLAALPAAELAALEDPASCYSFGWSLGRESVRGVPDTSKGSFYANPLVDDDTPVPSSAPSGSRHLVAPNRWPAASLPDLRPALCDAGKLMFDVGLLVAARCDAYCLARGAPPAAARLRDTVAASTCHKARLLHYLPLPSGSDGAAGEGESGEGGVSSWCGWHKDHGSLTALMCAQYADANGQEVACPDAAAGLYIKSRGGEVTQAKLQPDWLAFQMGEASQLLSGGLLVATPHCVRGARGAAAAGVARNTLALFMQPNWDVPMAPPGGMGDGSGAGGGGDAGQAAAAAAAGVPQWRPGQTFGDFAAATVAEHY